MNGAMGKWMAGVVAVMALTGCGNEKCDALGKHMAEVVFAEAKAAGNAVAEDKRAEIVKKTTEACNAEPPEDTHLDCALAAESTKAMKKCEGVEDEAEGKAAEGKAAEGKAAEGKPAEGKADAKAG